MKKVLILAYSFPPIGGGRVRRAIKFVKYLRSFGWEPVVLTVKRPIAPDYDPELLNGLDTALNIIRTPSIEMPGPLHSIRRGQKNKQNFIGILINKALDVLRNWIFVPDSRIGWVPFAVFKGLGVIKKRKIDVILVMGEPFSSFISGAFLKMLTKKPLVLDFRDEWAEFNKYFCPSKNTVVKKIEERLEAFAVKKADLVISVAEEIVKNFRKRYPMYESHKFMCITNGFDPDDYVGLTPKRNNEKFVIAYAGCLYKNRSPKYFLQGVRAFFEKYPGMKNDLKLLFMGSAYNATEELFYAPDLRENIDFLGFLPYRDALGYLAGSDILLYIEDQVAIADRLLPAKIFDYLALKKPVIALAKSAFLKEVIERSNAGTVVPVDDAEAVKAVLENYLVKNACAGFQTKVNEDYIRQFERKQLTQNLGKALDSLIPVNKS